MTVLGIIKKDAQNICYILGISFYLLLVPFSIFSAQGNVATPYTTRYISDIVISGNKTVLSNTILHAIPYRIGEQFDRKKTADAIKNIFALGRFEDVRLYGKNRGDDQIILHIVVKEESVLKDVSFKGNKAITDREIFKKIPFDDIHTISQAKLKQYAQQIKNMYLEKGYHKAIVDAHLEIDETDASAQAFFTVQENKKAVVKKISFRGNEHISDKELRTALITQEDWLLGFLNKAGSFHPEKTEADKYMLEQYYQNHGFMNARVVDVEIDINPKNEHMAITFTIEEGDYYTIGNVNIPGNNMLSEDYLRAVTPIAPGHPYSRERISGAIKQLERIWGDHGYIFAHINPSIEPNKETKTVDLTLYSDLGNQVALRRITIKGNRKTRDKVIRRNLALQEGTIITKRAMENSKRNVSSLGYFDPQDGVMWKIIRRTPDTADLDLIVKEAKTGHAGFQLSFGGKGLSSPTSGVSVSLEYSETNLFGYGTHINLNASWSANDKNAQFHIAQPWLFDKPITAALDAYHRRPAYNQLRLLNEGAVYEKVTGSALTAGYIVPPHLNIIANTNLRTSLGVDSIRYERPAIAKDVTGREIYQAILDKEFAQDDFLWFSWGAEQDFRNHPVHTSRGHRIRLGAKIAVPTFNDCIGFGTIDLDGHWFTPLIDERTLIFHLHGYMGLAKPLGNHAIPFGTLYHIGGEASVRGYNYGDIGPKFRTDTIGSTKAFFVNAELIFPINPDMTMKGLVFYDGGAGWDNPYVPDTPSPFITGNTFDYRHAIGFGLRMLNPMPIRIDWGFKIDPREGEAHHQVHFSTSYDW